MIQDTMNYLTANYITVHGVELLVRLGCSTEERAFPQKAVFDIDLFLDFERCIKTDDIKDTVNYIPIIQELQHTLADGEWRMIEKLSWDVAQFILGKSTELSKVRVRAKKNILAGCEGFSATVQIERCPSQQD
jgi:FolB domain-containing protein